MNVMGLGAMIYDVAKCDNNGVYCSVAMSWDCRYECVNELIQRRKRLHGGCRCGCLLLATTLGLDFAATRQRLASRGACGVQEVTGLRASVAVTTQKCHRSNRLPARPQM